MPGKFPRPPNATPRGFGASAERVSARRFLRSFDPRTQFESHLRPNAYGRFELRVKKDSSLYFTKKGELDVRVGTGIVKVSNSPTTLEISRDVVTVARRFGMRVAAAAYSKALREIVPLP